MVHRLLVREKVHRCGRYLKEKFPLGLIPSSSFHFMPWPPEQWCTWQDTGLGWWRWGWAPMCAFGNGRAWQRHLGGKSQCRALLSAPCCLPTAWGEPKIGVVCFSSARRLKFAFQVDLKMLIWMGLAMAFLVAGSIWRAADEWLCCEGKWRLGE